MSPKRHQLLTWYMLFQASLLEETIKPRANLPPLLVHLHERRPEKLHYLGVSFGLTQELFRFWRKHNFYPFYVGQIPVTISNRTCHNRLTVLSVSPSVVLIAISFFQSAVTGEHTCMVLRPLNSDDIEVSESNKHGFLDPFYQGTIFCVFCSIYFTFLAETA
jgi:N-acetyltransferase 10